jgi:hypothetical protein
MNPAPIILAACLLAGCASIRGEHGKFLLHESVKEDGTWCKTYLGRKLVWKCNF